MDKDRKSTRVTIRLNYNPCLGAGDMIASRYAQKGVVGKIENYQKDANEPTPIVQNPLKEV